MNHNLIYGILKHVVIPTVCYHISYYITPGDRDDKGAQQLKACFKKLYEHQILDRCPVRIKDSNVVFVVYHIQKLIDGIYDFYCHKCNNYKSDTHVS